ncbi:MAG TPA: J domain-containing protein [Armatimonadota bacterium]|jgi:curved DNA-binding protein
MNLNQPYKDYYAILGVKKDATAKEIKAAYRRLARKYHPDVNPGDKSAEDKFKDVSEANDVLSDADKRQKYDMYGDQWKRISEGGFQPGAGGYGGFGQGYPGGPGGRGYTYTSTGFPDQESDEGYRFTGGGLGDLLSSLFGGGQQSQERTARPRPPRKGADIQGEVIVSLKEAFAGAERKITVTLPNSEKKTLTVTIPRGVADGTKLRLAKQGAEVPGGGHPGDLILTVLVSNTGGFERKGDDLYVDVSLTFPEAALGVEKKVPLLAGDPQTLPFPPGVQPGQSLRLKGQGMPIRGQSGKFGDMYVRVKVAVPRNLTDRQRELIGELKKIL